jgi:hypothetical protein
MSNNKIKESNREQLNQVRRSGSTKPKEVSTNKITKVTKPSKTPMNNKTQN